ncbi:hypothetical protein [Methanococcus voltae]|uniref:Uncharacterized protein n=1 Tax=Methanococcus voltae (strain ATCC BAA-1334 / A3) TaxID=456320 RepID=D7DSW2_METV3|nr:hypothetical protein [Methanococcus voltae]MCS3901888.1 hypothetical protein [Methanococcus voltae]
MNNEGNEGNVNNVDNLKNTENFIINPENLTYKISSKKTNSIIKSFAELYFYYYVEDMENGAGKGIKKFKKFILNEEMTNNYSKKMYWLENSLNRLMEVYGTLESINNFEFMKLFEEDAKKIYDESDNWISFIYDENGDLKTYELLYQLRLAFAELYNQYVIKNDISKEFDLQDSKYDIYKISSKKMDSKIKSFAELYFYYYVEDKNATKGGNGFNNFKKNVLEGDIKNNGLKWLEDSFFRLAENYQITDENKIKNKIKNKNKNKNNLKLNYDGWLEFISNYEGNNSIYAKYELLYQLRLAFAELYNQYVSKNS